MERYRFRFEQKRGYFLIVEGHPPLSRGECDDFQLRMLTACDVPGLLKIGTEEIDGRLSLRYSLSGTRMLSQAIRTEKWLMADFMGALCRLAEVLEDCRLYALDAENVLLDDDRIFVGDDWRDLRFVYLPLPADREYALKGVEALIVRWMMNVTDLEGTVVQQLLRLAASPDFKPAALRGFTRQYLAEKAGEAGSPVTIWNSPHAAEAAPAAESFAKPMPAAGDRPAEHPEASGSIPGWRWFEPPSASAHSLSGLIGDESEPFGEEQPPADNPTDTAGRQQVWLICAAIGVTAVAWRWGYATRPGTGSLIFSLGVTLAAVAGCVWLRIGFRRNKVERSRGKLHKALAGESYARNELPRFSEENRPLIPDKVRGHPVMPNPFPAIPHSSGEAAFERTGGLLREADRTQQLDREKQPEVMTYYLMRESASDTSPVVLNHSCFVIGRSNEAAHHVDETQGVSRAHVEFHRTGEGWTVKDLGSRNGSTLNGVPMVPYESYPLAPEDVLDLAGSRYRFKYGNPRMK